jgi:hypothetical protein
LKHFETPVRSRTEAVLKYLHRPFFHGLRDYAFDKLSGFYPQIAGIIADKMNKNRRKSEQSADSQLQWFVKGIIQTACTVFSKSSFWMMQSNLVVE